ncbi:MMPL family transporter [Svornostia abyssi]|uniref:MMPL family transporter n=1 Tax=Svornostia abyssi TaxID=2898438 RepID=A0ABY5PIE0_9ACTN|nr:MMPL family transporter [Parviterribacteraceae bacterium J379]
MLKLAQMSIRHPKTALAVWGALALVLILIGSGVSNSLSPSITVVEGTESSRAQHLAETEFGPSVLVPVLLEGPKAELDKQGPVLVKRLADQPDIRVLSAWDGGDTAKELRPKPEAAMIVASVAQTEEEMVSSRQADIDAIVDKSIAGGVSASVTGQPTLDIAIKDTAISSTRESILLALPLIFLVLLLILRAPVAALALTVLGAATAFSSFGAVALMGKVIAIDAITLALGATTGLALGVGYGLLFYRRWREQVEDGHETPAHAALDAVDTGGRGILIGGTALIVALIVATLIAPTEILTSLGVGVLLSATLAVGGAVVVLPAAAALLGERLQAFSFPAPAFLTGAWHKLTGRDPSEPTGVRAAGQASSATLSLRARRRPSCWWSSRCLR